jgi:hypothetical protein
MAILVLVSKNALANCSPSKFATCELKNAHREEMKDERTSQSALNDVEVRDVAEEIGRTRCIGIALLFLTVTTICPRRISINRNHLGPVIGKGIAVCVRAHFDIQRFSGVFLRSGMGEGTLICRLILWAYLFCHMTHIQTREYSHQNQILCIGSRNEIAT